MNLVKALLSQNFNKNSWERLQICLYFFFDKNLFVLLQKYVSLLHLSIIYVHILFLLKGRLIFLLFISG